MSAASAASAAPPIKVLCHLPSAYWGRVVAEPLEVELSPGAIVMDLVQHLITRHGPGLRRLLQASDGRLRCLVIVNGKVAEATSGLAEGDLIRFVLPVSGG